MQSCYHVVNQALVLKEDHEPIPILQRTRLFGALKNLKNLTNNKQNEK